MSFPFGECLTSGHTAGGFISWAKQQGHLLGVAPLPAAIKSSCSLHLHRVTGLAHLTQQGGLCETNMSGSEMEEGDPTSRASFSVSSNRACSLGRKIVIMVMANLAHQLIRT